MTLSGVSLSLSPPLGVSVHDIFGGGFLLEQLKLIDY